MKATRGLHLGLFTKSPVGYHRAMHENSYLPDVGLGALGSCPPQDHTQKCEGSGSCTEGTYKAKSLCGSLAL